MMHLRFRNGTISSPFLIFVRCARQLSDEELLQRLGIVGFVRDPKPADNVSCVYLTEDNLWTHIADDWCYTLWHMRTIREAIAGLAKQFEIFTCSVGDSDHSFDFAYYCNGTLFRKYVVMDPHWKGGEVVQDIGTRLPGEDEALKLPDETDRVLFLASLLGIDLQHELDRIRVYSRPRARTIV
jgi:hypothetical protein